jgi:hypothetical protein
LPQSGPVFDNENLQRSAKEALRLATPAETADRRSERASDEPAPESRLDDLSEYEARTQIQARDTAAVHLDSAASADVTAARVFEQSDMARITAELAELKSAHERSQSEIAVLNAQLADALLQRDDRTLSELSELRAEVATLLARQHEATRTPLRDPASLMALQRAVDAGRPYAEELNRLPERTASRAFIEVLRAWSQTGVATRAALYGQFEQVARDALAIAANEHASGPLSGLQARIRGVFSLRPAYPKAGDAPDAIIARAEIRMRDEGIESALVELDSLQGRAREAFAAWTKEALARIAVDEAMNALEGEYSASYTN